MRISDWSSDVCSSDLKAGDRVGFAAKGVAAAVPVNLADEIAAAKIGVGQRQRDAFGAIGGGHAGGCAALRACRQTCRPVARDRGVVAVALEFEAEIGRASCRERVCQYV